MNSNNSKYQSRNIFIRRTERSVLRLLIFIIIPACIISYFLFGNPKLLSTIVILLSLSGLIQLEICGLFEYMNYFKEELEKIYDESGLAPSNLTRPIFEFYNPEPTWKAFITNNLYFNKRFGFSLLIFSGLLQLCIIWFT